jgi:hypothetical protein
MDLAPSLFDRFLSRPRPLWVALFVSLIILVLPFVAAMLDRKFSEFLISGIWRAYLMAPAIMLYIWLISPAMYRVGNEVVISFSWMMKALPAWWSRPRRSILFMR